MKKQNLVSGDISELPKLKYIKHLDKGDENDMMEILIIKEGKMISLTIEEIEEIYNLIKR